MPVKDDTALKYKRAPVYTRRSKQDPSTGKIQDFFSFMESNLPEGACLTTNVLTSKDSRRSANLVFWPLAALTPSVLAFMAF
jgi:hypothetical protein